MKNLIYVTVIMSIEIDVLEPESYTEQDIKEGLKAGLYYGLTEDIKCVDIINISINNN